MVTSKIQDLITLEAKRQADSLMLIPSENYAFKSVREAAGSVLSNKYSEGYPLKRYYQGNKYIDEIENYAIDQAKSIFGVPFANVQAYSGSPANTAIYFALLEPGDTIMGLKLSGGGHLTHGHPSVTFSGKYFKSVQFDVNADGLIDLEEVKKLAIESKPKLLMVGTTSYPRLFDWAGFRAIADEVGAILVADVSHLSGLLAARAIPSPVPYADVVMMTTHKSLRGPRGAVILVTDQGLKKDPKMGDKIDKAIMPGLQGGPHNQTTAGIALALEESQTPEFALYAKQILVNARTLADALITHGYSITTGGTDNHLMVLDLRPQKLLGNIVAKALEVAGIVVNRNSVPADPNPPFYPSGIRLGTPAVTARGLKDAEMVKIADYIHEVIQECNAYKLSEDKSTWKESLASIEQELEQNEKLKKIASEIASWLQNFPIKY